MKEVRREEKKAGDGGARSGSAGGQKVDKVGTTGKPVTRANKAAVDKEILLNYFSTNTSRVVHSPHKKAERICNVNKTGLSKNKEESEAKKSVPTEKVNAEESAEIQMNESFESNKLADISENTVEEDRNGSVNIISGLSGESGCELKDKVDAFLSDMRQKFEMRTEEADKRLTRREELLGKKIDIMERIADKIMLTMDNDRSEEYKWFQKNFDMLREEIIKEKRLCTNCQRKSEETARIRKAMEEDKKRWLEEKSNLEKSIDKLNVELLGIKKGSINTQEKQKEWGSEKWKTYAQKVSQNKQKVESVKHDERGKEFRSSSDERKINKENDDGEKIRKRRERSTEKNNAERSVRQESRHRWDSSVQNENTKETKRTKEVGKDYKTSASDVLKRSPVPLNEVEFYQEMRMRKMREKNLNITYKSRRFVNNKHDVCNLIRQKTGINLKDATKVLSENEDEGWIRVQFYSVEEKRNLMKMKGALRNTDIWIEDDLTKRQIVVAKWLKEVAADEEKRGNDVKIGYMRICINDVWKWWNEKRGLLENFRRSSC